MKENLLNVFMYLFDHWLLPGNKTMDTKRQLQRELEGVGFEEDEIKQALDWLTGLETQQQTNNEQALQSSKAFRCFLPEEQRRINTKARGFLLSLEQTGIIDVATRETIIERLMELDTPRIGPMQCKWVTAMVMFSAQKGHDDAGQLEDLLFYEHAEEVMH